MDITERREKIFVVDSMAVLRMGVFQSEDTPECFVIQRRPVLPDGAKIMGVYYDPASRGFEFVVWHESFDVVPDGMRCPRVSGFVDTHSIVAVREEDGRYRIDRVEEVLPKTCNVSDLEFAISEADALPSRTFAEVQPDAVAKRRAASS